MQLMRPRVTGGWHSLQFHCRKNCFVASVVAIYPFIHGADPNVLKSDRPRLEFAIWMPCLVGLTFAFFTRVATDDFSAHDGFAQFLVGAILSRPGFVWRPRTPGAQRTAAD